MFRAFSISKLIEGLILVLFMGFGFPGAAFAQVPCLPCPGCVRCTVSGSPWVIVDTNGNGVPDLPPPGHDIGDPALPGDTYDSYWSMWYDPVSTRVFVFGHGIFPNPYVWRFDCHYYQKSTQNDTIVLEEESSGINNLRHRARKVNGAPDYNHVEFEWIAGSVPYAQGTLTDSNGDGLYDSVVGESNLHLVPPILFDNPIKFENHGGQNYWVIGDPGDLLVPGIMLRISRDRPGQWFMPRSGPYRVFVPVGTDALEMVCGAESWGRVTLNAGGPTPDIKANGSDGPLTVSPSTPVSITGSLDPGDQAGQNADWWVYADTPFGQYSYVHPSGWQPGLIRTIAAPLFALPSTEILNRTLPAGDYVIYFAVDDNADGILDETWYDSVEVTVQNGVASQLIGPKGSIPPIETGFRPGKEGFSISNREMEKPYSLESAIFNQLYYGSGQNKKYGSAAIPTLNEWRSSVFMLLVLIVGIWVMRKTGFGDGLSNR